MRRPGEFFESGFRPVCRSGLRQGGRTVHRILRDRAQRVAATPWPLPDPALPQAPGSRPGARPTRAEIEDGALAGRGLELLWVDDPIDAFFLQIQGSGRVRLSGGGTVRVGYDGQNGHPYVPVGRLLIERGVIPRDKLTMAAIRSWMKQNPEAGAALRRENPSYVFFREIKGDGPIGAEGVALSAERSLAVDRAFVGSRHPGLARSG